MQTVWLAETQDYDASGVDCAGESKDAVIQAVRDSYGEPYIVTWEVEEEGDGATLIGEFEQVLGYSTRHVVVWRIFEMKIARLPSRPGLMPTVIHIDGPAGRAAAERALQDLAATRERQAQEEFEARWGDTNRCPSCESTDIDRQTADEGRPFSCNNCGLEFFKDTAA